MSDNTSNEPHIFKIEPPSDDDDNKDEESSQCSNFKNEPPSDNENDYGKWFSNYPIIKNVPLSDDDDAMIDGNNEKIKNEPPSDNDNKGEGSRNCETIKNEPTNDDDDDKCEDSRKCIKIKIELPSNYDHYMGEKLRKHAKIKNEPPLSGEGSRMFANVKNESGAYYFDRKKEIRDIATMIKVLREDKEDKMRKRLTRYHAHQQRATNSRPLCFECLGDRKLERKHHFVKLMKQMQSLRSCMRLKAYKEFRKLATVLQKKHSVEWDTDILVKCLKNEPI